MLNVVYFSHIQSTQKWLVEQVKNEAIALPVCVLSEFQTQGVGSRNNHWENVENALMFSFALCVEHLPSDLFLQSTSIYFGFLFKQWLESQGFSVWLKWPNDFYLKNRKIGGIITQRVGDHIICGIGLNLNASSFASLGVHWEKEKKIQEVRSFLAFAFGFPTWSYIFENYKIEFYKNLDFTFHFQDHRICLGDVCLCEDGSVLWKHQKIYSLR